MRASFPAITVSSRMKQPLSLDRLQAFAQHALPFCLATAHSGETCLAALSEIHVLLISDRRMAALHRQFLDLRGATDVITFQHGEIFISVQTAALNAQRFKTTAEEEVQLYLVHGLLHLHGFNDTAPAQSRQMEAAQKRIVRAARKSIATDAARAPV